MVLPKGTSKNDNISTTGFIILAGGKSNRFGCPKVKLKWGQKTFLDCIFSKASKLGFGGIYLSANEPIEGYSIIRDEHFGIGPVEGIYRSLRESKFKKNFVLAVDIPQIPEHIIIDLVTEAYREDFDCTFLSYGEYVEPLIAVYDISTIPHFEEKIKSGNYSVNNVAQNLKTGLLRYNGDLDCIRSINTVEDYNKFIIKFAPGDGCVEETTL